MSSTTLISLEEYLARSDKPTCEYIDGVLHPKPLPTKLHALIEFLLVAILRRQGVDALAEVSVRLSDTRVLVPDVIAAPRIQDPYPTEPVKLCVEILSPGDRLGATFAKCEQYHSWSVPYCWVIDPVKQTAWEYHSESDPARTERDGTLRADTFVVKLTDLFSQQSE
jgi:Uma2 family endonuclease